MKLRIVLENRYRTVTFGLEYRTRLTIAKSLGLHESLGDTCGKQKDEPSVTRNFSYFL